MKDRGSHTSLGQTGHSSRLGIGSRGWEKANCKSMEEIEEHGINENKQKIQLKFLKKDTNIFNHNADK